MNTDTLWAWINLRITPLFCCLHHMLFKTRVSHCTPECQDNDSKAELTCSLWQLDLRNLSAIKLLLLFFITLTEWNIYRIYSQAGNVRLFFTCGLCGWWVMFTEFFGEVLHSRTSHLQVLSADLLISHSFFIHSFLPVWMICKGWQRINTCLFVEVCVPDHLILQYQHILSNSVWTAADVVHLVETWGEQRAYSVLTVSKCESHRNRQPDALILKYRVHYNLFLNY